LDFDLFDDHDPEPGRCNLSTASKWFQVADQPSKAEKVVRLTNGVYLKVIQSTVGKSLGTDSYIFSPCETPTTELEKTAHQIGSDSGS
jgi:hypothetical protein